MTTLSPVVFLLRKTAGGLMIFLFPSCYGPARKYWREEHYMRGPGPKWRAKQSSEGPRTS